MDKLHGSTSMPMAAGVPTLIGHLQAAEDGRQFAEGMMDALRAIARDPDPTRLHYVLDNTVPFFESLIEDIRTEGGARTRKGEPPAASLAFMAAGRERLLEAFGPWLKGLAVK